MSHSESLILTLDFRRDPPGVMVIRETIGARLLGLFFGMVIGLPLAALSIFSVAAGETDVAMVAGIFAVVPLAGASMLAAQVFVCKRPYVAIDDANLYRRWPFRGMEITPLRDLSPFSVRRGCLSTTDQRTGRALCLLKGPYSPEPLVVVAERLNSWRASPIEAREAAVKSIDLAALNRATRNANALVISGLTTVCLVPILIWAGSAIGVAIEIMAVNIGLIAVGQLVAGIWLRIRAFRRHRTV